MSFQLESDPAHEYITVNQAAKFCKVTRFTIRNWVVQNKIRASRTAGGHRRILKSDLLRVMEESGLGSYATDATPFLNCWEYARLKRRKGHQCEKCLVYKNKVNKCFLAVRQFDHDNIHCSENCATCPYLQTYFPEDVEKVKKMNESVRCWEFMRSEGKNGHTCNQCLVFKERMNKCFLVVRHFDKDSVQCDHHCSECAYLEAHFPNEKKKIAKLREPISCWEFVRLKGESGHKCKQCLVFKQKLNKCFLAVREFDQDHVRCSSSCSDCVYVSTYYPKELEKMKNARKKLHGNGSPQVKKINPPGDGKKILQLGLYQTGHQIGMIKHLWPRKKSAKAAA